MIRVFPKQTKATPNDDMAFIGEVPLFKPDGEEVHISCTFIWDKPECDRLADNWERAGYKAIIGGPAYDDPAGDFVPGRFLKTGYVITSRGCNNHCWFCSAWRREGKLRELPITEGWNVLDNNLLQCSKSHIRNVFAMLKKQNHPIEITGGLEAKLLNYWHINLLVDLKPRQIFFAYDTLDDYEPLIEAGKELKRAEFRLKNRILRCYVLIGFKGDTFEAAEKRLSNTFMAGF